MTTVFTQDYLEKLTFLEKRAGSSVGYKILEPFPITPHDAVDLNSAAKKIAGFVGIRKLVLVAITEHSDEIAGHIELQPGSENVYIEVARDILDFPAAVLETLAHEMSHEFLHSMNISWGAGPESHYHNEVLTDITAVFLGLGKLMLNGAESKRIHRQVSDNRNVEVTQTRKIGYLDRDQMAFVCRLVCAMRRIDPAVFEEGLSAEGRAAIRNAEKLYGSIFFDTRFHSSQSAQESINSLTAAAAQARKEVKDLKSELSSFEERYLTPIDDLLLKTSERTTSVVEKAKLDGQKEEFDPALTFLQRIKACSEIESWRQELSGYEFAINQQRGILARLQRAVRLDQDSTYGDSVKQGKLHRLLKRVFKKTTWGRGSAHLD
jgi:hypothetical protein